MALPGEIGNLNAKQPCIGCKAILDLKVLSSNAGYYVGTFCNSCGPVSRETHYGTEDCAKEWLKQILNKDICPGLR